MNSLKTGPTEDYATLLPKLGGFNRVSFCTSERHQYSSAVGDHYRRWFANTRKQGTSIRYVGHFDDVLLEEIRNLNPDLKDPDHLEDGQLIRIPLREATLELIGPSNRWLTK
jgi:hypothetical protein